MSYILDALRRAEADRERERGQVPGLHTQAPAATESAIAAGPRRWLPWAGAGLLLTCGIGAGIWWASGPQQTPAPAQAPQPVPAPVASTAPAPLPSPAAPVTPATSAPAVSVTTPSPAASVSPYLPPAPPPDTVRAAPAPAVEARIPRLAELPENTRNELPKLAISGTVYSDDPASSFVIINGEVQREGARLGADLVLEQIRPRELVLRFKGQRYRQPV